MSGTISKLLRLMVQGNKEAKVTRVNVTDSPTKFNTQLPTALTNPPGYGRRRFLAYANQHSSSGEVAYGYASDITFNDAMILPRGERFWIPVDPVVDVYFISQVSGETNLDLRVEEIA
jgi:hypothetical protein